MVETGDKGTAPIVTIPTGWISLLRFNRERDETQVNYS
jgi:hypothetical protein